MIKALLAGCPSSINVTHIDGLVLAKSAFNHSMNYRSAVIYGVFEQVRGGKHKMNALDAFMDKIAPGRKAEVRAGNDKELAATSVLRVSLDEAAAKVSKSGPVDKPEDAGLPVWAGVLPLRQTRGDPIPSPGNHVVAPLYVSDWGKRSPR